MSLEDEITNASKKVVKDGYDMSIGELMSLYRDRELIINPKYQRYFRWDISQKTKFIESLLLGIPIPPIFVYTTSGRKWELVDGLQRMSTIFEFAGILRDPSDPLRRRSCPHQFSKELRCFPPCLINVGSQSRKRRTMKTTL